MKTDEELFIALREATSGLLFMSESDYPLEVISWSGSDQLSPEYLRRKAGLDAASLLVETDLETFFRVAAGEQEWKGEAELIVARKYQHLMRLLKENLTEIRVYRVGEIKISVSVVGRSEEGNWMGVSTQVIET
jgi:hypothetical protein